MGLGFEMVTGDILKPSNLGILTEYSLSFHVLLVHVSFQLGQTGFI